MLRTLVPLLALVAVLHSPHSQAFQWDAELSASALKCSDNRAAAYLDVVVVYDRTIRQQQFGDLVYLLKKELLPLSLHGDPTKTSRVALIGFDSKASADLDISTTVTREELVAKLNALPSKRTQPTDKAVLTDALRLALRMLKKSPSTRDLLVILAVSTRSVDSDTGAHGTTMELQDKGAHVLTLNLNDENLLLDAYLTALADNGKAFSPYREPYFAESFSRAIDYANCRCRSEQFEDGQPVQQLSVYNYTSNHVDYYASCLGAAFERGDGATIREWCAAFEAQPLPVLKAAGHSNGKRISETQRLDNLYHFVESFLILNNYELNKYNAWIIGEVQPTRKFHASSRNSKRLALLNQQSELALSRASLWDYITVGAVRKQPDTPFVCQRRACDAARPCDQPRHTTNYFKMLDAAWKK